MGDRGRRWFEGELGVLGPALALVLLVSALIELAGLAIGKAGLRERSSTPSSR